MKTFIDLFSYKTPTHKSILTGAFGRVGHSNSTHALQNFLFISTNQSGTTPIDFSAHRSQIKSASGKLKAKNSSQFKQFIVQPSDNSMPAVETP